MKVRIKEQLYRVILLLFLGMVYSGWTLNAQQHQNQDGESEEMIHAEHQAAGEVHNAEAAGEEKDMTEVIMDHIKDSHEWHLLTTKEGHHVSIPLPVIIYSKHSGLHVFMSSKLAHGHSHKNFSYGPAHYTTVNKKGESIEKDLSSVIVEYDKHGQILEDGFPLDLSITKNVFMMFLAVVLLLVIFLSLARSYKKTGVSAPKGMQGFLEPLVVFVEEDIAIPNIGMHKYERFMPYLLTVFFFILCINLFGLIPFFPFGANVTGNIAVTMVLAVFTLLITNFSGNKTYWGHIFFPPGVPVWLLPIMIPVELLGIITKPFALMIRLFANITAGHIIVLSLVSLIFIFKSIGMAIPSLIMVVFMDLIELLVAFLQAYIFTLLSALFIGLAVPEHHHE